MSLNQFIKDNNIINYELIEHLTVTDLCNFLIIDKDKEPEKYDSVTKLNMTNICLFNFEKNNNSFKFALATIQNTIYILGFMWFKNNSGPIINVFDTSSLDIICTVMNKTGIILDDDQAIKLYNF